MYCPGCGSQANEDLRFCRQCGANLRGVREAMVLREEKFDWGKTWVADMFLPEEERERRRGVTPAERRLNEIKKAEENRLNEIKGGVITGLVGIGATIFLRFFLETVARGEPANDAEIIRHVWLAGIIPILVGVGLLINGLFVSRRLVQLKEQHAQTMFPSGPLPTALPAKATDALSAGPPADFSVTENTTAHLPAHATVPSPRRETE
jgi:hypothetical protein